MTPLERYEAELRSKATAFEKPRVFSPLDDLHIFHYSDSDDLNAGDCMFALVNRNGNHMRIVREDTNSPWRALKTWNGLTQPTQPWMTLNLRHKDPIQLCKMLGTGPQGNTGHEQLTLFPRELMSSPRKVNFRDRIISARFMKGGGGVTLEWPDDGEASQMFRGKIWEDKVASKWCLHKYQGGGGANASSLKLPENISELSLPEQAEAARLAKLAQQENAEAEAELENTDAWGLF